MHLLFTGLLTSLFYCCIHLLILFIYSFIIIIILQMFQEIWSLLIERESEWESPKIIIYTFFFSF